MNNLQNLLEYEGYCATFQVDKEGDRFVPGCFTFCKKVYLLYEHEKTKTIGNIINIQEDKNGLWVQFAVNSQNTEFIFNKNEKNDYFLSIGFTSLKEENILYRNLKKILVHEVSIVKNPAQFGTYFKNVIKRKI